jgi:hypothetical protein
MRNFVNFHVSNRKILRCLIRVLIVLIVLNILKYLLVKLFTYDDLLDQIHRKNLKSVQLLTGRFDYKNWEFDELGEAPFRQCAEKRCYAYRSLDLIHIPNERANGIMVHGPNLWYLPSRKSYRRDPKQLWLFYTMESQGLTFCSSHYELTDLDDWFNLTATFKSDSDLYVDYKQFRNWNDVIYDYDYVREYELLSRDPAESLTDLAAKNDGVEEAVVVWFVSHCETYSRRELYVQELMKHIKIDIYGKCDGYFPAVKKDPCGSKKNLKCWNKLMNRYKFYLAFENSLCEDYITEKYWKLYDSDKIFSINIIPVVRGARDEQYKREAPNRDDKFYIHSDAHVSPKSLAAYLNHLNANDTAYMQFFQWKLNVYAAIKSMLKSGGRSMIRENRNVSTYYHLREPFCKMCSMLHNQTYLNSKTNKVWKLSEWFAKKTNCWDLDEERVLLYKFVKFFGFCF